MLTRTRRIVSGASGPLVSCVLVAGCATSDTSSTVVYTKAGVGPADRQRDESECLRSSVGLDDQSRILVPFQIDRHAFRTCMEARGYAETAVK
jgi:hypothetical protein